MANFAATIAGGGGVVAGVGTVDMLDWTLGVEGGRGMLARVTGMSDSLMVGNREVSSTR